MNGRKNRILLTALSLFLWAIPSAGFAADDGSTRQSLRGIKGIYVSVENIDLEVERYGLTRDRIRSDVESSLQKAGIKTIPREDWYEISGNPFLYVDAHVLKLRTTKEFIYSINIALKQNVYLTREPVEILEATTWSLGSVTGITGKLEKIRDSVKKQVERFIKAYLSANQRPLLQ